MNLKKQMKYPILFGSLLGGTILTSTIVLATVFPVSSFLEEPLSTIVNIPQIMPYFTVFATLIGIALLLFIYSAFNHFGEPNKETKILIGVAFIIGLMMIWTPYNDKQLLFKIIHTFTGLGLALSMIIIAIKFNKISRISNKSLAWIRSKLPSVMGIETLGIRVISGINLIMEIYFFTLATLWLVLVGITIKEE